LTGFNPRHVGLTDLPWNVTMMASLLGRVSIDAPYWTLQREVLFYIVIAAMTFVAGKGRMMWCLIFWVILSSLYNRFLAGPHFYEPADLREKVAVIINSQFCYLFVIGMTLFSIKQGNRSILVFVTFGLAVLSSGVSEWAVEHRFSVSEVIKALAYAATLFAFASLPERWFKASWLLSLGAVSYSMYLVHETIGYGIIRQLQALGASPNVSLLVGVMAILLLAIGLRRWVELPANDLIRGLWRSRGSHFSKAVSSAAD
jgi:peptidoglycan/LPS O-acetylase OafA/YrhL